MKVEILDQAENDLISAFAFHEDHQEGLGRYFRECLFADIDSLRVNSAASTAVYRQFQRSFSKRFPFAIFYTIGNETVYIQAIVECRREPAWIERHLRDP